MYSQSDNVPALLPAAANAPFQLSIVSDYYDGKITPANSTHGEYFMIVSKALLAWYLSEKMNYTCAQKSPSWCLHHLILGSFIL